MNLGLKLKFLLTGFVALSIQSCITKDIVYLIRDDSSDYNDQFWAKADLNQRLCIWNKHWEPNTWLMVKQLLEKTTNYEFRTPPSSDRLQMFAEFQKPECKWVIDGTYNLPFSYNLDPTQYQWLLDKMGVIVFEPVVVADWVWKPEFHARVAQVFTWDDSYIDNQKYFLMRYPFYSGAQMVEPLPFEKKKLCCFINGNKGSRHSQSLYEKRREDVEIWDKHYSSDFDFYGTDWSRSEYRTFKNEVPGHLKVPTLRKYRFCLCYENMNNVCGWVTEKMFNCLEAGCVPVYMGVKNIDQFVPRNCYVAREQFESNEHLHRYLKNMSKAEYEQYLENIRVYLKSDQPKEFGYERFAEYIVAGIVAKIGDGYAK